MKVILLSISMVICSITMVYADTVAVQCPATVTCRYNTGGFVAQECQPDNSTLNFWTYFKINGNEPPTTSLPQNRDGVDPGPWVRVAFSEVILPYDQTSNPNTDRPRCLYGAADPFIPDFVSLMAKVPTLAAVPENPSTWQKIVDQYNDPLYVCTGDAKKCTMQVPT